MDNALKWSPDGPPIKDYCIAGGAVTVRDHGPGINPEDLPHLRPLLPAPAARALPGSGLGLAIVAQVAEAEGGAVTASNADDGGAVFQLALPPPPTPPDGISDAEDDEATSNPFFRLS